MYRKRIVPEPEDIGTFDRSGLRINAGPSGYAVTDVARDRAGAAASIAVGDVIIAIKPAASKLAPGASLKTRSRVANGCASGSSHC